MVRAQGLVIEISLHNIFCDYKKFSRENMLTQSATLAHTKPFTYIVKNTSVVCNLKGIYDANFHHCLFYTGHNESFSACINGVETDPSASTGLT